MVRDYVNAVLGIAVLVVAFLGLTGPALSWTLGILGLAILISGLVGAGTNSTSTTYEHRHA
jgi:hypothetical protein